MGEGKSHAVEWARARERLAQYRRTFADHTVDPDRIDAAYRQRAAALARPPQAVARDTEYRRVVVFRLGAECFAAPLDSIDRIFRDPVCTPLPGVAERWAGVMIADGEIVPVLHLPRVLGLAGIDFPSGWHILKLHASRGDLGLLVGEVLEVRSFSADELRPSGGTFPFLEGIAPGNLLVLDIDALIAQESSQ